MKRKEPTKPKKAKQSKTAYSQTDNPPLMTGPSEEVYYNGKKVEFPAPRYID